MIHCRPLQAGARWRELVLLLLLLLLLLLQLLLLLLLLLLLQRPNEFHTESDRTIWCTGTPNKTLSDPHKAIVQHFAYAITDDLLGGFPVQADQGPPDLEPIRSGPSSAGCGSVLQSLCNQLIN